MAKLKNPLLSLKASGSVGRVITFLRRGKVDLVEKKPEIIDVKSAGQLGWRHMFNKCVDLWHLLSVAEKVEWESAARSRHMTGYAWYMSQCLRPNPGIYLPLQGGTMAGDINMATHRVLKLLAPVYVDEAVRKSYVDALPPDHTSGTYSGDNTDNRPIAHGLGTTPKLVLLYLISGPNAGFITPTYNLRAYPDAQINVTAWDATNFYVTFYTVAWNNTGATYTWVAFR